MEHFAIRNLTTKAMKFSFKISTTLTSKQVLNSKVYTQLFGCMVKPVVLYGAAVWGEGLLGFSQKNSLGNVDSLPFKRLHNKICKCALEVGKYVSNAASRAELGRYPLLINVAPTVVSYWCKILMSPDKLVHQAY